MPNPTEQVDAVKLLSDDEVAEIEARHNAASPGPWSMTWNTSFGPAIWSHGDILVRCEAGLKHSIVSKADPAPQWQKDMDFIRAAREDIPALCATVRALRDIEQRYKKALSDRLREMEALSESFDKLESENTALREQLASIQQSNAWLADRGTDAEQERETLLYWLLRAYHSGNREGWEEGPSTDETMHGILCVLANRGYDPNLTVVATKLLERKPRY